MNSAGWFPDPEGEPGLLRWWDGTAWSEQTIAAGSPESAAPPGTAPTAGLWSRIRRRESAEEPEPERDWRQAPGGPKWDGATRYDERPGAYGRGGAAGRIGPDGRTVWFEPEPSGPDRFAAYEYASPPAPRWYRHPAVPVVAILVVLIGLIAGVSALPDSPSDSGPVASEPSLPTPTGPPLAQLCSDTQPSRPDPNAPRQPVPAGPRIADPDAKISYAQQGPPFRPWDQGVWASQSESLGEEFTTGQYFITQQVTPGGGPYMTTVLSGTVPATYGDDPHPNIECAARVISEDVRKAYYPLPNERRDISAHPMTISGRPAYYLEFHLSFDAPGYNAKGELVAICVIDVPGSKAAALYVSIPDTHKQFRSIVPKLMSSIRVMK
ncbi:MAG TPA: DUF2510 domain-containing protein [Mycobacteriales bacterium]|nr:DUF2510 domain-containing protein [Mycobacteriales bacterium]